MMKRQLIGESIETKITDGGKMVVEAVWKMVTKWSQMCFAEHA
jgi:hypothetical protein